MSNIFLGKNGEELAVEYLKKQGYKIIETNNTSVNEIEQALEEKWKNATIANNFIFYKVMSNNPDVCK